MRLTKNDILKANDIKTEVVEVPEWGGSVEVQGLNGKERDAYTFSVVHIEDGKQTSDMTNVTARLVAASIIDEKGNRMFNEAEIEDLGRKSSSALQRVFEVASRLSGLSKKDIEDLAKNSESAPSGASLSN